MPEGFFHADVGMVSRSGGRSSVAAAAYRAGEELRDHRQGLTHDYSKRAGVVSAEILLPEGASAELGDRGTLWNAVEAAEKRIDSQVARDFMIAIPHQLTPEEGRRLGQHPFCKFFRLRFCTDGPSVA